MLYLRALEICEQRWGSGNVFTSNPLNALALLYKSLGKSKDSLQLFRRAFEIRKGTLGLNHPETTSVLDEMAEILENQNKLQRARQLREESLAGALSHLTKNLWPMAETERFQYLDTQAGLEPLLLNLGAIQGNGPTEE